MHKGNEHNLPTRRAIGYGTVPYLLDGTASVMATTSERLGGDRGTSSQRLRKRRRPSTRPLRRMLMPSFIL